MTFDALVLSSLALDFGLNFILARCDYGILQPSPRYWIAIIVKENQMKLQQLISNIKESEKKKVEDFFTVI